MQFALESRQAGNTVPDLDQLAFCYLICGHTVLIGIVSKI
ncbi:hypothetical protein ASAP_1816 [Asaia bogorensis]|uniref:Uncharacterized protein n=1 Tax=Asaia bogorensis TaxID=91915 RepID=A0A060QKF6_9PROT|nr:hypothetical protein ASAP_1816 [Asaia bogorensis]